jgi:hypothetical protein
VFDLPGASLAELQRWFQAAIMSPDTSAAMPAATVITASTRQQPAERLAIYQRGYRLRLRECLRNSFPALCHLLGRDLFDAFADDYLDACPSHSYTLFQLGKRFAEFLEHTRPDRDRPPIEREAWVDLMVDLAHFERAFAEIYHGPGTETGPVLRGADLPADTDPAWPRLVLRPAPCLRLISTRYPVHAYAAAIARGAAPQPPPARSAILAMHRRAYAVVVAELTPPTDRMLMTLLGGQVVAAAAATAGIPLSSAHAWIRRWAEAGLFSAYTPPQPDTDAYRRVR